MQALVEPVTKGPCLQSAQKRDPLQALDEAFTEDPCLQDAQHHDNAHALVEPDAKRVNDRRLLGSVKGASSGGACRQMPVSARCWAACIKGQRPQASQLRDTIQALADLESLARQNQCKSIMKPWHAKRTGTLEKGAQSLLKG